MIDSFFLSRN